MSTLTPLMPYAASEKEQIDEDWVADGGGVEAIFFSPADIDQMDHSLDVFTDIPGPKTVHFPMVEMSSINDKATYRSLCKLVELSASLGALGVVCHSNYLVEISKIPSINFEDARREISLLLNEVGDLAERYGLWLGIENMPIIGDEGDNTDALFVFPSHYRYIESSGIVRVLALAHWVGSLDTCRASAASPELSKYIPTWSVKNLNEDPFSIDSFPRIGHSHISKVSGLALPFGRSTARGGAVPSGEIYADLVARLVRAGVQTASLEIAESDYSARVRFYEALGWLEQAKVLI